MLTALAVANYRSLLNLKMPLGRMNVITGANGSGKSNVYRALRLLAETAQSGVVGAISREGGRQSVYWAGPETLSQSMRSRDHEIQGGPGKNPKQVRLGFAAEDFSYAIVLGLPIPSASAFSLDLEVKSEAIWAGPFYRPASSLVVRTNSVIKTRSKNAWNIISTDCPGFETMFGHVADPALAQVVYRLRETIQSWRFYDQFRADRDAPSRVPQLATRTPVLQHDGSDFAAALQTIREMGDSDALDATIHDAFPGSTLGIHITDDGRFSIVFQQYGLLRPLSCAELSDGTLRFLLWVAALLTPRPPALMVLNEPETSLHPDLLLPLARLIKRASENSQVWVISHSNTLITALAECPGCRVLSLVKELGVTTIAGQNRLDEPVWAWPT